MSKKIFVGLFTVLFALALLGLDQKSARSSMNPTPTPPYPTPSPVGTWPSPVVPPFFPPNEPPPLSFTSLTLEILAPTQTVLLLQPVPLVVKLTNRQSRPALGYKALSFGASPIYLDVKKTGTTSRIQITQLDPVYSFSSNPYNVLQPGEIVRSNELITLRLPRYFPEPGSYEIRAKLANGDQREFIESEPLTIVVREPGPLELPAYNLIRNSAFSDFLFSGLEFNRAESTLETLSTLHPQSPYARYANFLLGETYFHRRDYIRALAKLTRLENSTDFIFADKVRRYLAEIRAATSTQP